MEKKFVTENIYYVDNFFPEEIIERLHYQLLNDRWIRHFSDLDTYPDTAFWGSGDITDRDEYYYLFSFLKEKFKDIEILRVYANGATFTQHGEFHQDDGDRTYLIGINKYWNIDSGGATEFVLDKEEMTTISVYPKWNRMVSFPADIMHRALPFFKLSDFRMTLAIKTEKKENSDQENSDQENSDQENYEINFI